MAARAHAGTATAYRTRRRPAARRRPGPRRGPSRVNWDRVGRVALTLVLAAVLYSYLNPAIDFVKTYRSTSAEKAQLHKLQALNAQLHRQVNSAGNPVVLDGKARGQGMIAPGETAMVVSGVSR